METNAQLASVSVMLVGAPLSPLQLLVEHSIFAGFGRRVIEPAGVDRHLVPVAQRIDRSVARADRRNSKGAVGAGSAGLESGAEIPVELRTPLTVAGRAVVNNAAENYED